MVGIDDHLENLHKVLRQLFGCYETLLDCLVEEKKALVQVDIKNILKQSQRKQGLIRQAHLLEKERRSLIFLLSQSEKKDIHSVSELEKIWEGHSQTLHPIQQIKQIAKKLRQAIQNVFDQNQENKEFIENSLLHISRMKKSLLENMKPHLRTYTSRGLTTYGSTERKPHLLSHKA